MASLWGSATVRTTPLRAWFIGAGILLASYVTWFIALQLNWHPQVLVILMWFLWGAPFVAALLSAYLAPHKKILVGLSMALLAAVFAVALNFIHQLRGDSVDFPGMQGSVILFFITLAYSAVFSGIGAISGSVLARKFHS